MRSARFRYCNENAIVKSSIYVNEATECFTILIKCFIYFTD